MDLGLHGKTALVTGASKGIGLAIAEALAQEGCHLMLVGRQEEPLRGVAESISARHGVAAKAFAIDLSVNGAADQLVPQLGELDILVNNAGAIPAGNLGAITDAELRMALELKLFAYMRLAELAFASMRTRGDGVILNIIGTAGERPRAGYAAGSIANAALIAMTRALGLQGSGCGIRVVGLHPGATRTDRKLDQLQRRAVTEFGDADQWPKLVSQFPYGRLAEPAEIGKCAAFLCSKVAAYVNATCLTADGGATDAVV